jgi:hypothetical protein
MNTGETVTATTRPGRCIGNPSSSTSSNVPTMMSYHTYSGEKGHVIWKYNTSHVLENLGVITPDIPAEAENTQRKKKKAKIEPAAEEEDDEIVDLT